MEFIDFLPAVVSGFIITPIGLYIRHRMKSLATSHDFDTAISQLAKSTNAVESIKSQMSEKFWVKQQVWDTKRAAYEELLTSLYLVNQYLEQIIDYLSKHNDCFIHIGYQYSAPYDSLEEEEHIRSYEEYIEDEQASFKKKYESEEYKNERDTLHKETIESIAKLKNVFSIKSIYLLEDIQFLENDIDNLKHDVFEKTINQDEYECNTDYFERILEHYIKCSKLLASIINKTKALAVKDLKVTN
ncbi:hypothetical protein ABS858_06675 [Vibrio neptunius]|uniref:hypothetical protein n=1 Tax=Vibrio neptunius TaxID=170651 RepID=UPI003315FAD7